MDPLSIPMAVITLIGTSVEIARATNHLHDKYKHAQLTIASISLECSIISTSLTCIQQHMQRASDSADRQISDSSDLREVFSYALTGCNILFEALVDEIDRLLQGASDDGKLGWKTRSRYIWKEGTMNDLLGQLRGQQTALTSLMQALQMQSMTDLNRLVRGLLLDSTREQSHSSADGQLHVFLQRPSFEVEDSFDDCSVGTSTADPMDLEVDVLIPDPDIYGRTSPRSIMSELGYPIDFVTRTASSASSMTNFEDPTNLQDHTRDADAVILNGEADLAEACRTRRIHDLRQQLGEMASLVGHYVGAILHKRNEWKPQGMLSTRKRPYMTGNTHRPARPRSVAWRVYR